MSTNTTSTSDRSEVGMQRSSPGQEGAREVESVSPFSVVLPDPAVIARLANEFFAALPGAAETPGASVPGSPNDADLRLPSGSAPRTAVPDYQREIFSSPAVPSPGAISGLSQMPMAGLNEADFQAIAASLADVMALVPPVPTSAFSPAVLSPSSSS